MSAAEIREISRPLYAAFLVSVPHSVFQRLAWLELVEQLYPIRIMPLGCFVEDRMVAVIPLMQRRFGPATLFGAPLRRCPVPPATLFCAPSTATAAALGALETWARRGGVGYLQVTCPAQGGPVPVGGDGVEILDNLELRTSRPLEELWQLLAKKTRYTVRRAFKDGVRLHWSSDAGFIEVQARLLRDTYSRQGKAIRPNYPHALYRTLLERQHELGLRVMYATCDGQVVAAAWILADARRCYYWDAATASEGRRLNANQALVWCLIRWAHRHGFDTVDFVGTARGGRGGSRPGIGHFKRSMGAEPVEYHIVYWYSPVYRFALAAYRALSRIKRGIISFRRAPDAGEH
jgi:hypothetical protein